MFAGLYATVISIGVAGAVGFAGGGILIHKLDNSRYESLELSYKNAQIAAIQEAQQKQKELDTIAIDAARKEIASQAALTRKTKKQLAEVSKHVKTTHVNCVTLGFIRVLDAAARGTTADSLALPARRTDDSCTSIDPATLARSIVDNYNTAQANSNQLNSLIAVLRKMAAQQQTKK